MELQFSDMPKSVAKFCNAIGDLGNIYYMYTVDMDGNITNEAFGKNVITDYGLLNRWKDHSGWYLKLYVGNSTDEPTLDGQSMINRVISVDATTVEESRWSPNTNIPVRFPIKYIPATENRGAIMTQRFQLAKFYYDYNISGVTEDIVITEIGLGESDTKLYSHSLVYDSNGNVSSIIKKPNERLYIQTYWQGAIPISYIEDCYSKGQSVFIEPFVFAAGRYPDGYNSWYMARSAGNFSQYASNGTTLSKKVYAWTAYENTLTELIDHTVICNTKPTMNSLLLEHKFGYLSGITFTTYQNENYTSPSIDYFISHRGYYTIDYYSSGWHNVGVCDRPFILHEFLKLPNNETEEVESEFVYTNSWSSNSLTNSFGRSNLENIAKTSDREYFMYADGSIPVIDFDITAMSRYNHKTKEWDITESFYSDPDWNYDDSLMEFQGYLWTGEKFSVRVNPHWNTKKILKFNTSGVSIYATDTYWDTNSYQLIPNISSVPDELSNKKYYLIKGTGYKRLVPVYHTDETAPHKLLGYEPITIDMTGLITSKSDRYNLYPLSNMLSSDKNGWILLSKTLLYPDAEGGPKVYPIKYATDVTKDNELNRFCRHATDDMIIICDWSYSNSNPKRYSYRYRIYDVSNPDVEPPYIDIDPPFTAKSTSSDSTAYQPIFSWADSGLLCGQQYGYNEACVIDVNNWETPVIRLIQNCRLAHIQNLTEYVVYQRSDITLVSRFEIMNPRTGKIVDTFDLPDYQTYTVNGICGWKTNVYIYVTYNGINDIIKYDMNTHALEFNNEAWNLMYTNSSRNNYCRSEFSNEECYIITSNGDSYQVSPDQKIKGSSIFISAATPMNIEYLYNPNLPEMNRLYFGLGSMKYIDNGNNLVYVAKHAGANNNQNSYESALTVFDIGKRIDSGEPLTKIPYGHMPYTAGLEYGIYKDYIFAYDNGNTLTLYPIAWSLAHKVKGTTHTITSYNNPVRISGKKMHIKLTNDMEKVYNYDPSHNICP